MTNTDELNKIQTELFMNLNMTVLNMLANHASVFVDNPLLPYTVAIGMLSRNIGQLVAILPKETQDEIIKFANCQIMEQMQVSEKKTNIHMSPCMGRC